MSERIDDLQWNGLKLIQDEDLFCFGCDAVELSAFVTASKGEKGCDLGAGNGIISVLLAAKKGVFMSAVEILEKSSKLIEKNVELNNLTDKIKVFNMPMQEFVMEQEAGSFDFVVTNPPYMTVGSGEICSDELGIARHELKVTAKQVIECSARLLKFGGKLFLVYPASRLAEIMSLCTQNLLEPKILQILTPNAKKNPHLFLLSATKNAQKGLIIKRERVVDIIV